VVVTSLPATSKRFGERRRYLLIQMEGDWHRSGCFLQSLLFYLRVQHRGIIAKELIRIFPIRSNLLLNFFDVIEVVGESTMNVSESDRRDVGDDFVGRQALVLIPDHNVLHPNAMATDASPAAGGFGCFDDSLIRDDAQFMNLTGILES
jgi:hypothetical protein